MPCRCGLHRDHAVRRYGFHGTSHRFVAQEAVRMLGLDPADHGLVTAHLGNGASATAVQDGRSVDTAMGMTPLEGLVMGTRPGDVDAGALIYLMRRTGWTVDEMDTMLNKQCGLLGLSELSNDCRELSNAAAAAMRGRSLRSTCSSIALRAPSAPWPCRCAGLDAVVFTGGIGENAAGIRAMTLQRLRPLGIEIDAGANLRAVRGTPGIISAGNKPVALVVNTDEEWMIACDTAALAQAGGSAGKVKEPDMDRPRQIFFLAPVSDDVGRPRWRSAWCRRCAATMSRSASSSRSSTGSPRPADLATHFRPIAPASRRARAASPTPTRRGRPARAAGSTP